MDRIKGLVFALAAATSLTVFPHAGISQDAAKPEQPAEGEQEGLVRLSPKHDIWLDKKNKQVVLKGFICLNRGQLEMLVTLKGGKEHEAVVAVDTEAKFAHAALLALGAKQGTPVSFRPKYKPPTGTEVDVRIRWVDSAGKMQEVRGQDWVRYIRTQRAMQLPFVFAGSGFYKDEDTGETHYLAEEGDFICVSNFPSAMCDVPSQSSQGAADLMFEAFSERIPPVKTPVTVLLRPKLNAKDNGKQTQPDPGSKEKE